MKKIFISCVLCASLVCVFSMSATAQTVQQQAFQTQQMAPSGSKYVGTVYEPFNGTSPSQYQEGQISSASKAPSRPRRGFDTGAETGQSTEFPIGEPWVMALFAALFAGAIAWRNIKSAKRCNG